MSNNLFKLWNLQNNKTVWKKRGHDEDERELINKINST